MTIYAHRISASTLGYTVHWPPQNDYQGLQDRSLTRGESIRLVRLHLPTKTDERKLEMSILLQH